MAWIQQAIQVPIICNYSINECRDIFESEELELSDLLLVTTGRLKPNEPKHVVFLRLFGYKTPLRGSHNIAIYSAARQQQPTVIHVDSLSSFRINTLHFIDRLSFERATFVCVHKKQVLIRVKCIRSLLRQHSPDVVVICNSNHIQVKEEGKTKEKEKEKEKNRLKLSFRTKTQFVKNIEQLLISYTRDLSSSHSKQEIKQILKDNIALFLV